MVVMIRSRLLLLWRRVKLLLVLLLVEVLLLRVVGVVWGVGGSGRVGGLLLGVEEGVLWRWKGV